jgi:hypothetical protein
MKCIICGEDIKTQKGLLYHIKHKHQYTIQQYYNLIYPNSGVCPICGHPTSFLGFTKGYRKYCSNKCATSSTETTQKRKQTVLEKYGVTNISKLETIKQIKAQKFDYNSIRQKVISTNQKRYKCDWFTQSEEFKQQYVSICRKKYHTENYAQTEEYINKCRQSKQQDILYMRELGYIPISELPFNTGWRQSQILPIVRYKNKGYIRIADISIIEGYYSSRTHLEQSIINDLSYDGIIITHTRKIISPYELDIYLPEISLAIEFNGTHWHSVEFGTPKDYHLTKSILCKTKGIRLIHIYEFEDLEEQIRLVNLLINGTDLFPQEDFNKNNLYLNNPPSPCIIYNDNRHTVYGAGRLVL